MLEAENAFTQKGLEFAKHAIAITGYGSKLHQYSQEKGWLDFLPMWDWVGGRTSETAAVGLLPAALQGIDVDHLLAGAKQMDDLTRNSDFRKTQPPCLLFPGTISRTEKVQKIWSSFPTKTGSNYLPSISSN